MANADKADFDGESPFVPFEGRIIDSIIIENRDIYETDSGKYDALLFKAVNALHIKTKAAVVRRELLFRVGDTLSIELLEESARNIRQRLSVFNAWIEVQETAGILIVKIITIDEWSLTTSLNITRNGSSTDYRFGFDESNLFGNNQFVTFDYVVENRDGAGKPLPESDQNYIVTSFSDPRFLGLEQSLFFGYSNNERNSFESIGFGRPYYDLRQKYRYELSWLDQSGRRDFYQDELRVAEADYKADRFLIGASARFGSYYQKLRLNFGYNYAFERALDHREIPHLTDSLALPNDSLYHEVSLSTRYSTFSFEELTRIDGVGYTEDFVTGFSALLGIARANDPDFRGFRYHRFFAEMSRQWYTHGHLIGLEIGTSYWMKANQQIRSNWQSQLSFYNNGLDFFTFAFNWSFISDRTRDDSQNLIIGGSTGMRGFDTYFRTGDRKTVANIETRFFPNIEFLSANLGGVLFLDCGRTWKPGEDLTMHGFLVGGGAGLRIHVPRLGRDRVIRVDLGYSDHYGWQVSVGTNQYFRAPLSGFSLTNL